MVRSLNWDLLNPDIKRFFREGRVRNVPTKAR